VAPPRLQALTGIRGVAAWWVVVYHVHGEMTVAFGPLATEIAAWGFVAVDFFFQLSGFIIALNYFDRVPPGSAKAWRTYLMARFSRVYPMHALILLAYLANPLVILCCSSEKYLGARYDINYYVMSIFLVQNWGFTEFIAWNVPAWSVSTEAFAYICFPLLAAAVRLVAGAGLLAAGRCAIFYLVIYLGFVALWSGFGHGLGGEIARHGLLRCVAQFFLGVVLYAIWRHAPTGMKVPSWLFGVLALAGMAATPLDLAPDYILVPPTCSCLIYWLATTRGGLARVFESPLLVRLGEISYATYISHYLVRDWVKFLLMDGPQASLGVFMAYLLGVAVASVVLYHLVEEPARAWLLGRGRGVPPSARVLAVPSKGSARL